MIKRDKRLLGKLAIHPTLGEVIIAAFRGNDLDKDVWVMVRIKGETGTLSVKGKNLILVK